MNRLKAISLTVIIVLATASTLVILLSWISSMGGATPTKGAERAGKLISALEIYRQGWGRHPENLEQLVPDFLSEVPRPSYWSRYYYEVCPDSLGYMLEFRQKYDVDNWCEFSSNSADWTCTDSAETYFDNDVCYEECRVTLDGETCLAEAPNP